jgi:hypothetical protein
MIGEVALREMSVAEHSSDAVAQLCGLDAALPRCMTTRHRHLRGT